jgi:hypothetical protein
VRTAAYGAAGLALVMACAAWVVEPVQAGSSVEARTVAGARKAAAEADARAKAQDATTAASARTVTKAPAKADTKATRSKPGKAGVQAQAGSKVTATKPAPKPGPAKTAKAKQGGSRVAAVGAAMRPTMGPVPARSPATAHLDDQVTYQYNALGRRDPFMPLVGGMQYVAIESPPDVGALKVVGVVWGVQDKFAIVEDGRGSSSVLRLGDKVMNGVVEGLKRDGVVVRLTVDGQSQSVTIPLTRKGDSNANR